MTFDTRIWFKDLAHDGEWFLETDKVVMEVKAPGVYPMWLARTLSELGIKPSSYSKYGTAYKMMTGQATPFGKGAPEEGFADIPQWMIGAAGPGELQATIPERPRVPAHARADQLDELWDEGSDEMPQEPAKPKPRAGAEHDKNKVPRARGKFRDRVAAMVQFGEGSPARSATQIR
ncbi:MAG: hypothetical protein BZ138_06280 [Methanosphaera sp. rholeuAM270]|nr:MAG: hypothetical protein BZ138_06280 [Methanosphaera sp. rholeuAM270]